jgi:hypothetical protein
VSPERYEVCGVRDGVPIRRLAEAGNGFFGVESSVPAVGLFGLTVVTFH